MMQMVILSGRISEGVKRMDDILYAPELESGDTALPSNFDVVIDNVTFSYDEGVQAVKNVSCTLKQGTVTGLVGPSGGGKSTLASLLLRFYDPQEGSITVGGMRLQDFSSETLSNLVSFVFQESFMFHDTIENNIRMGDKNKSLDQVIEAAKAAEIHDVIMNLPDGYKSIVGENGVYLSGGEQQRLAIARVIFRNTPIVVLDEATAYADAENEAKIQKAFARLAKNKTVLIIAHRLKTIENADRILVMKEGSLIGQGSHEELMSSCEDYKEMVYANDRRDKWNIGRTEVKA